MAAKVRRPQIYLLAACIFSLLALSHVTWASETQVSGKSKKGKGSLESTGGTGARRALYTFASVEDLEKQLITEESEYRAFEGVVGVYGLGHLDNEGVQKKFEKRVLKDFSAVLFEDGKPAGGFVGVKDTEEDVVRVPHFRLEPHVLERRRALQLTVEYMVDKCFHSSHNVLQLTTSPEDAEFAEVLGQAGFFLDKYEYNTSTKEAKWEWLLYLPRLRTDRFKRRKCLVEELFRRFKANERPTRLLSGEEQEMTSDNLTVLFKNATPVEQHRARTVVVNNAVAKWRGLAGKRVDLDDPSRISILTTTHPSLYVTGILSALCEDDGVVTVDYLSASEIVDDYAKAKLIAELLVQARRMMAEVVVIKGVPEQDVGTIGVALELGFRVASRNDDGFELTKNCREAIPEVGDILLSRKLRHIAMGTTGHTGGFLDAKYWLRRAIGSDVLNAHHRDEVKCRERLVLSSVFFMLATVFLLRLAHKVGKLLKVKEFSRNLRQVKLPADDNLVLEHVVAVEGAIPEVTEESQVEFASKQ